MTKENQKGAAGLRRSAIAERLRLREEWSALKEIDESPAAHVLKWKPSNSRQVPSASNKKKQATVTGSSQKVEKTNPKPMQATSDALSGVVALVDVGSEARALPLRAVLAALGATVVTDWSPLVTHLVWTDSGTRSLRARARALACKLVSPLWVEACAAAARKLSERMFPAASRQSDLPSPRTLRQLLKKAERENVPLVDLLSDSKEDDKEMDRLMISSGTDTSRDKTTDTSNDSAELQSRINTAPRGGTTEPSTRPPAPPASRPPPKSRRKLFTHKEAQDISSSDDDSDTTRSKLHQSKMTQSEKRDLARAERLAKKMLAACTQKTNNNNHVPTQTGLKPRIVLTGMSRLERQAITKCIQKLGGVIQNSVNKRTTHVLLGSCTSNPQCNNHPSNIPGISSHCDLTKSSCWSETVDKRARTVSALCGAARGARVLQPRWAVHSAERGRWLQHHGYEVQHLKRISQKARVERSALGRLNCEYAYDVFNGMRVRITDEADQRDAAIQLLTLCGAVIENNDNNGIVRTQNGVKNTQNWCTNNGKTLEDVLIGNNVGEVNSKWVFDSVAAARMRTTRRYLNMNSFSQLQKENRILSVE
ncbi:microcephalin [Anticarsia gemmatalis]|uniref:microcephalin n=1 Tax=Anticarsia gemmatalis TaxID=129554 RepID=UPI003F764506